MSLKFSIITPSYNQGAYIRDTIESVLEQNYDNYEHIIIDGGSTDNTLKILEEYPHLKWISELDKGPAEAINKGFKMADGEVFAWINSDDFYSQNIFQKINSVFESDKNIQFLYGNLTFIDSEKRILFKDKSKSFTYDSLINYSPDIRQPGSFYTKDIIEKVNYLNESIKIVFDYDLFIKLARVTTPFYYDENIAYYRDYPETITRKNVKKQALEIFKVSQSYGGKLFSPISKLAFMRIIKGKL